MSRFIVTQKGQPSDYISQMARVNNTPRGQLQSRAREGSDGNYAAEQFENPNVLLSGGLHPPTPAFMPSLGALDIEFNQTPLYTVPTAMQVIRSALTSPSHNSDVKVYGESLGSTLRRARRFYF